VNVFIESNDPDRSVPFYKQKMIAKHGSVPGKAT
jgi:hypothetical protein